MEDEVKDKEGDLDELRAEIEELEDNKLDQSLQGYNAIEYSTNNIHDQSLMEFIGKILDSGFTTNQIEAHLFEYYGNDIKTL